MSGPKVVRIVTREEIIAICKDHLAQLEASLQQWERIGRRNEVVSDKEVERARTRHAKLRALLAADRFTELQKQVPAEIAYLKGDNERRLAEAASRAASARLYGSRLTTMAHQMLERSAIGKKPLSDQLKRDLEAIVQSKGVDREGAEKVLAEALASRAVGATPTLTPEQLALAERLRGQEKSRSLEEWLQDTLPEADAVSLKTDKAIEELSLVAGEEEAAPLLARYRSTMAEPAGRRRQMLSDTLMLEVGNALASAKARAETMRTLELRAASLSTIDTPQARELTQRAFKVLSARDATAADVLTKQISAVVEQERKVLAAKAQRAAVVSALKELGYEVREGMETAAPLDGKVILRRAANTEMGVEVAGIHAGGRVQFRPIRFGPATSVGDTRRDRDIETLWCSDFDHLKRQISGSGELFVEQARPVGAVPVLFVCDSPGPDARRPEIRTPNKARSLP